MQRQLSRRRGDVGFTLIEVLIAAVLLVIGMVGSLALVLGMSRGSQTVRARDSAYFLAQQVLDQSAALPLTQLPFFRSSVGALAAPTCFAIGDDLFIDHPIACGTSAAFYLRSQVCCAEPAPSAVTNNNRGGLFTNSGVTLPAWTCTTPAAAPNPLPNMGTGGAYCVVQVEVTWPTELAQTPAALLTDPPTATALTFQNHIIQSEVRAQ